MILGETLFKSSTAYYSPWVQQQGDAATFATQLIAVSATGTLNCVIETKNATDADTAATVPTGGTITLSGSVPQTGTVRVSALKQLLRFRYDVGGASSSDWVHHHVLPPAWERNGATVTASGTSPQNPT